MAATGDRRARAGGNSLTVGVLGPLEVAQDGRGIRIASAKQRALVALLALNAGRVVSADRLIEALWGDRAGGDALNALQHHVSRLRKAVGPALVARAPGYLLEIEQDGVDALRFVRLVREARTTLRRGDSHEVAVTLRRALALWRAVPLAEFVDGDWARQEASRLEELYLATTEDRIEADLATGLHADVVEELRGLLREYPFRERLWGQLMLALYRCGRQTDALAAYRDARRVLAEEHGVDPGPELVRLERAILDHAPDVAAPPRPPAAPPAPALPVTEPPLPGNLPAPLTSFIGRHEQVPALRALLADRRLVTLTGPPGVGKTRLAVEVARAAERDFPDGVWLSELAPLSDPPAILDAVAAQVGLRRPGAAAAPDDAAIPPLERLVAHLRRRRGLLILDNCEHLVAGVAATVEPLLAGCPELRVLATSREALGVVGEAQHPVLPLSLPPAEMRDPRELVGSEAVRLFEDRAIRVRPAFALTAETAPAVAEVCRQLDGLPLALELAAARVNVLPVQHIARALGDRFRLLVAGGRTAPGRQQTLRAAVDWSYALLDADERRVFEHLSVFAGGCSLAEAEAAGARLGLRPLETLDVLGRLIDKSLVTAAVGADGQPRYHLLETLRAYGVERLVEAGQYDPVRRRHAERFAALAEAGERELLGAARNSWLRTLDEELDNLRGVLRTALAAGEPVLAVRVAGALGFFFSNTDRYAEGRFWLEAALAAADDSVPVVDRARALTALAPIALQQGDGDRALAAAEQGLALALASGDQWRAALSKATLALTLGATGRPERVPVLLAEARAGYERIDEPRADWGVAQCEFVAALAAVRAGDAEAADRAGRELLVRARRVRFDVFEGWARLVAGWVAERRGDLAAADGEYGAALALVRPSGLTPYIAFVTALLGRLAMRAGRLDRARRLQSEAAALLDGGGSPWFAAFAHSGLGVTAQRTGDLAAADALHRRAVAESPATGSGFSQERFFRLFGGSPAARSAIALGLLAQARGDPADAVRLHLDGIARAERDADLEATALALEGLAATAAGTGEPERAAVLLGAADAVRDRTRLRRDRFEAAAAAQTTAAVGVVIGPEALERGRGRGRGLPLAEALALARRALDV